MLDRIELEHIIKLPFSSGQEVVNFLKSHKINIEYDAYTINNRSEIINCKGIIENNGSWHPHHNYDNSEDEMYVIINGKLKNQWFSVDIENVKSVLKENVDNWKLILEEELKRLS